MEEVYFFFSVYKRIHVVRIMDGVSVVVAYLIASSSKDFTINYENYYISRFYILFSIETGKSIFLTKNHIEILRKLEALKTLESTNHGFNIWSANLWVRLTNTNQKQVILSSINVILKSDVMKMLFQNFCKHRTFDLYTHTT